MFVPEEAMSNVDRLENIATNLSRKITDQEVEARHLEHLLFLEYKNISMKGLPISNRISMHRLEKLEMSLNKLTRDLMINNKTLSEADTDINAERDRITEHENFDPENAKRRLACVTEDIQRSESDFATVSAELERIEARIHPHMLEHERLKSKRAALEADIGNAEQFIQNLEYAANSYERRVIHQKCEEKFGTGNPNKAIGDRRRKIQTLDNNIPKIERRIQEELKKQYRTIDHILIDGNNICYERQVFIGLRGISALLPALRDRFKVTVVFDASIRAMLNTGTHGIGRLLGPKVSTYVVPAKTAADEYLMRLADEGKNTFILSNDRFAEYYDYNVVTTGRILPFMIADGKLMVNDLDISVNI
ncbi:MAG: hypothetical protein GDA36_06175 [Rhodobacteraceae bacterium]|nr:hypothetical protein [Paracoccaceae bacterium]